MVSQQHTQGIRTSSGRRLDPYFDRRFGCVGGMAAILLDTVARAEDKVSKDVFEVLVVPGIVAVETSEGANDSFDVEKVPDDRGS